MSCSLRFWLIALTAAMGAHERQGEIGLFIAMGATRNVIVALVIAESLVLAVIGGIAGVAASLAAFFLLDAHGLLTGALQVSFRMPLVAVIGMITAITVIIVITGGSTASVRPAYHAAR